VCSAQGLAFSERERDRLHLRGLLPPAVLSLRTQMERVMINVRMKASDLERYSYMQSLQERNEYLFFKVVREHIAELLPIVHLPTVRQACKKYGLMFKSLPRSLFLTRQDVGNVRRVLKNWPERFIKVVMITDGECVGPAGDLGVHAVNAVIAKLGLMTAIGGVNPAMLLPVQMDLGTNNEELLKSQFYSGLRHKRLTGDPAEELTQELIQSIQSRFGKNILVFFEDIKYRTAMQLLSQYG
jgi:malate dehydrogenase (oxaloacetate-decarboxylating)(NADP+)